jgi:Ankyrin repeat
MGTAASSPGSPSRRARGKISRGGEGELQTPGGKINSVPGTPASSVASFEVVHQQDNGGENETSNRLCPATPQESLVGGVVGHHELDSLRAENARLRALLESLSSRLEEQAEINAAQVRASVATTGSASPYTSAFAALLAAAQSDAAANEKPLEEWLSFKTFYLPSFSSRMLITIDPLLMRDKDGFTLLHNAAKGASVNSTKALLEAKILPVDVPDWAGRTPLMLSTSKISLPLSRPKIKAVIEALIHQGGADVDAVDLFGRSVTFHLLSPSWLTVPKSVTVTEAERKEKDEFRAFIRRVINEGRNKRVEAYKKEALLTAASTALVPPATPFSPPPAPRTVGTAAGALMSRRKADQSQPSLLQGGSVGLAFGSPAFKRLLSSSSATSLGLFSPPPLPLSQESEAGGSSSTPSGGLRGVAAGSSGTPSAPIASQQYLSPTGPYSPALLLAAASASAATPSAGGGAAAGRSQPASSPLAAGGPPPRLAPIVAAVRSPMADLKLQSLPSRSTLRPPQAVAGLESSLSFLSSDAETMRSWCYSLVLQIDELSPIRWPSSSTSSSSSTRTQQGLHFPLHASPDEVPLDGSSRAAATATRGTKAMLAELAPPRSEVEELERSFNRALDLAAAADGDNRDQTKAQSDPAFSSSSSPSPSHYRPRRAPQVVVRKVAVPESLIANSRNLQLRAVELSEELGISGYVSVACVGPFYVDGDEGKAKKMATAFADVWKERIKRDANAGGVCRAECCKPKVKAPVAAENDDSSASKVPPAPVPCPLHGGPGSDLESRYFGLRRHKCYIQGFPVPASPSSRASESPKAAANGDGKGEESDKPVAQCETCMDCWLRNHCPQTDPIPPALQSLLIGENGEESTLYCEFSAAMAGKELCAALTDSKLVGGGGGSISIAAVSSKNFGELPKRKELLMLPPLTTTSADGAAASSSSSSFASLVAARRERAGRRIAAAVEMLLSNSTAGSSSSSLPAFPPGLFALLPKSKWLSSARNEAAVPADTLSLAGRMQGEGKEESVGSAEAET